MKNIHILRTDKPSRLWVNNLLQGKLELSKEALPYNTSQHIYITSDEDINKDTKTCWCIDISCNELVLHQGVLPSHHYKHYKKIIMTTDNSINVLCSCGKDCGAKESGVHPIDDTFLEWFTKNPSCEEVEVVPLRKSSGYYDEKEIWHWDFLAYKIIIPKEEPNQKTIEELAKDFYPNEYELMERIAFKRGYTECEERMYSRRLNMKKI